MEKIKYSQVVSSPVLTGCLIQPAKHCGRFRHICLVNGSKKIITTSEAQQNLKRIDWALLNWHCGKQIHPRGMCLIGNYYNSYMRNTLAFLKLNSEKAYDSVKRDCLLEHQILEVLIKQVMDQDFASFSKNELPCQGGTWYIYKV